MNGSTSRASVFQKSQVPENSGTARNVHHPSSEVVMWAFDRQPYFVVQIRATQKVFAVKKPFYNHSFSTSTLT